jgi:hypothetical protein
MSPFASSAIRNRATSPYRGISMARQVPTHDPPLAARLQFRSWNTPSKGMMHQSLPGVEYAIKRIRFRKNKRHRLSQIHDGIAGESSVTTGFCRGPQVGISVYTGTALRFVQSHSREFLRNRFTTLYDEAQLVPTRKKESLSSSWDLGCRMFSLAI